MENDPEGHRLWAELERVVTPDNVNRIPDDWEPPGLRESARQHLAWIKEHEGKDHGFLAFLTSFWFDAHPSVVKRFVQKWSRYIEWKMECVILHGGYGIEHNRLFATVFGKPDFALLFFCHGCPCPEDYLATSRRWYQHVLGKPSSDGYVLLGWLLDHGHLDLTWAEGPKWINDFCERYKWRRARCQRIAVILCGAAKRSPYFAGSRDMARLLARYVWSTRRATGWFSEERPHKK